MAKENKSINKWIFFAYGILFGLILLYGLYFMTMYANVHVMYLITEDGTIQITSDSSQSVGGTTPTNKEIWNFFEIARYKITWWSGIFGSDGASTATTLARKIYNFQINASSFNDLIIVYSIVGLIAFAGLIIFANHTRKVYYISNLASGISIPLLMIAFSALMIFKNINLMADFTANKELYTVANYYMNTDITSNVKDKLIANEELTKTQFLNSLTDCNSSTFIIGIILYVAVIAFSVFIIVITLRKYKATAKKRAEVIQRAVLNND